MKLGRVRVESSTWHLAPSTWQFGLLVSYLAQAAARSRWLAGMTNAPNAKQSGRSRTRPWTPINRGISGPLVADKSKAFCHSGRLMSWLGLSSQKQGRQSSCPVALLNVESGWALMHGLFKVGTHQPQVN